MAVSIKIGLKQTQKLILTQSLKQSIEMLQLSTLELSEIISQELVENPVLEEESSSSLSLFDINGGNLLSKINSRLNGDDAVISRQEEKEEYYPDASDSGYSGDFDDDRKRKLIENAVAQQETLNEHLMSQARIAVNNDEDLRLYESIITSIDENGLLSVAIDILAMENSVTPDALKKAIDVIGNFDPPGCGAPSIQESIRIQARYFFPEDTILHKILSDHFKELERLDYAKIAKNLGIPLSAVIERSKCIHSLTPYPGRLYSVKGIRYIIPDIEVKYIDGEIIITINDDYVPQIRINNYYISLLNKKNIDKNLKEYIKDKVQSARYLLKNISTRRDTILKVVSAIMQHQTDFLIKGPGHLKPLTHTEIAQEVGLHESTVSRVTSNKFVQSGWGVFELKYFFVSKLKSANTEEFSSDMVINLIKDIISAEDGANPYSDEEILQRLQNSGINLARRTIAKYRSILRIPSSNKRKKLNMIRGEVTK